MDKEKDYFLPKLPFFGCCLGQISIHRAVKNPKSSGFKLENRGKPAISENCPCCGPYPPFLPETHCCRTNLFRWDLRERI